MDRVDTIHALYCISLVTLHDLSLSESSDEHLTRGGDESFMASTKSRTDPLSIFLDDNLLFEVENVGPLEVAGGYVNNPFEDADDNDAM